MTTVGVIGLGALGGAMAGALLKAGHPTIGFDIDPGAGARFEAQGGHAAARAAEVLAAADLVILTLRDQAQIETLLDTIAPLSETLRPDAVIWLASTVSPGYATALGERLAAAGAELLDGPVSGGVSRAGVGKLTLILAGSDRAVAAAMTLAPALADHVYRVATVPGPASAIKAVNQLLTASHIALTAEALGLAIRAGVDPHAVQDVINASAGASRMFADRAPRMLADDITPHATLGIFLKDLGIALDAARQCGAATPLAEAARDVFRQAAATFGSDVGDPAIFRLYRSRAAEPS